MARPKWITLELGKQFISLVEMGDILGVSEYVASNMLQTGAVPSLKVGREYRIAVTDLEEYINAERGAVRDGEVID